MSERSLLEVHGDGNCHICGKPKISEGSLICSYPHGMIPIKAVDADHPEGFWEWSTPTQCCAPLTTPDDAQN